LGGFCGDDLDKLTPRRRLRSASVAMLCAASLPLASVLFKDRSGHLKSHTGADMVKFCVDHEIDIHPRKNTTESGSCDSPDG
jgi:hypothetical protein